jgi:hypothetical protein
MKRFFLLTAAVLVTGFAFAQESNGQASGEVAWKDDFQQEGSARIEEFNAEINIGVPIHWNNGLHDDAQDKIITAHTSIGIGIALNFTKTIGWILDADINYSSELSGISTPASDYISLFGANVFMGPLFYLFNNEIFRVPLVAGLHMYYFKDSLWIPALGGGSGGSWISREDMQFGAGFSIGFQFHFDSGVYIFSRTSVFIDFIRIHSVDKYDGVSPHGVQSHMDMPTLSWSIKPVAGIGIRF